MFSKQSHYIDGSLSTAGQNTAYIMYMGRNASPDISLIPAQYIINTISHYLRQDSHTKPILYQYCQTALNTISIPISQYLKRDSHAKPNVYQYFQVLPHVRNPQTALSILSDSLTPTGGISLSLHSKLVDYKIGRNSSK